MAGDMKKSTVCSKKTFEDVIGFPPTASQKAAFDLLSSGGPLRKLTIIRLPCGEGKTEAVLAPFLAQFATNDFSLAARMVYVLPTRALCNSLKARIEEYASFVCRKYGKSGQGINVELQHGSHPGDPWFLGDVVVTTLDQFIYGYARSLPQVGRHLDIPAGSLASSIVVMDECHGYEPYTFSLVRAMIEILVAANVPVVLMTATLPQRLLEDLCQPAGKDVEIIDLLGTPRVARSVRPVVIHEPVLKLEPAPALNTRVISKLREHKKVLVVLNVVDEAQKAFDLIRQVRDDVVLVHSRFMVRDRTEHEKSVAAMLGKDGIGGVVVSTQVCEAGLDVSADLLITQMSPGDSLVQRSGRCARFSTGADPAIGEMIVFDDGRDQHVYDPRIIEETRQAFDRLRDIDFGDWRQAKEFVRDLSYRVDEARAAQSLWELQEATLFADTRPANLQVREGSSVQLWVGTKDELKDYMKDRDVAKHQKDFRDRLISVSFKMLLSKADVVAPRGKYRRITWMEGQGFDIAETSRPVPFGIYLLDPKWYDTDRGVMW